MTRNCILMFIATAILALPSAASAHGHKGHKGIGHYEVPAVSLMTIDACLSDPDEDNQWLEEDRPNGLKYCERIGPHKEHPVEVELVFPI